MAAGQVLYIFSYLKVLTLNLRIR